MVIRLFVFFYFTSMSLVKAQDSLQIEYIDLGLPDVRETYTNTDKYGKDKSQWPIWTIRRVSVYDFKEDTIHLEQLTLNDYFWFSFDENRPFQEYIKKEKYWSRVVIQNNMAFAETKTGFRFSYYYMYEPGDGRNTDVDIIMKGELIDMNSLESVKEHFPNSYAWRDGRMNPFYGGMPPDSTIHFNSVNFIEKKTMTLWQFYYYKGKLVCIYGG